AMRVVVDLARCQGYAQCAYLAPDAFRMVGDEALMFDPAPGEELRDDLLRAERACPVQAIQVDMAAAAPQPAPTLTGGEADARKRDGHIVIVGASLAGLRAAEMLRTEGFSGALTMIGDEPDEPYDRPPLSKQVQTGWITSSDTALPRTRDIDAEW